MVATQNSGTWAVVEPPDSVAKVLGVTLIV
jgi:hypothetical protein